MARRENQEQLLPADVAEPGRSVAEIAAQTGLPHERVVDTMEQLARDGAVRRYRGRSGVRYVVTPVGLAEHKENRAQERRNAGPAVIPFRHRSDRD